MIGRIWLVKTDDLQLTASAFYWEQTQKLIQMKHMVNHSNPSRGPAPISKKVNLSQRCVPLSNPSVFHLAPFSRHYVWGKDVPTWSTTQVGESWCHWAERILQLTSWDLVTSNLKMLDNPQSTSKKQQICPLFRPKKCSLSPIIMV